MQFDIVWEDKRANHEIIEAMLREAAGRSEVTPGTLVVLPELGDTGFSMNLDRIVDDQTIQWACDLARRLRIFLQVGYAERGADGRGRNCAGIVDPRGELIATYRKVHPFSYGREAQFYSGGDRIVIARCGDALISPMICYDLRFPELWRLSALQGAEVFAIGASWPAARQHHWRALLMARAIENQAYVVAVNRIGADPHLKYAGGSIIISPKGEVLAEANDKAATLSAELDLESLRQWRREFPALRDVHRELLGEMPASSSSSPNVDASAHQHISH